MKTATAYGETHDAEEWADILGCSKSAVYAYIRRAEHSGRPFGSEIVGHLLFTEDYARTYYPGVTVAELADRNRCGQFSWTIENCVREWTDLQSFLWRKEHVLNLSDDFTRVMNDLRVMTEFPAPPNTVQWSAYMTDRELPYRTRPREQEW